MKMPRIFPLLSQNKFYLDELYDWLLVKPIVAIAKLMRRVVEPKGMDGWVRGAADAASDLGLMIRDSETGFIRDYASWMVLFAAAGVFATVFWWAK